MRRGLIAEIANTIIIGGAYRVGGPVAPGGRDRSRLRSASCSRLPGRLRCCCVAVWQPVTATTTAFVEVSILRRKRSLQAIWVQAVLYVAILVFDLVWLFHYRGESSVREFLMRPAVLVFLLIVTPLVASAAMWYHGCWSELPS